MAENLRIKEFGPIKDVKLSNIQQFLILVGESGSGKSTILKVLSMCRWIFKQQNIRCYLHEAGISRSPFTHNVNDYLNSSGLLDFIKEGSQIIFERDGVTIEIIGKAPNKAAMDVTEPSKEQLCLEKVCFITEKRNMLPDLLATRTTEKYASYYVKQLFESFKQAQDKVFDLDLSSVDVHLRLVKKNGNEMWMIENKEGAKNEFSIRLEDASSGIQSSVPLDVLVEYYTTYYDLNSAMNNAVIKFLANEDALKDFRPTLNIGEIQTKSIDLLIEEPEMCLYPSNQVRLINSLIARTMMDEHPYVVRTAITTHSPYLLNYLNLLFKAYDKDTRVSGVNLCYDSVNVYAVENGELRDLKVKNAHLIDPTYLSEPIDNIYNQYDQLDNIVAK